MALPGPVELFLSSLTRGLDPGLAPLLLLLYLLAAVALALEVFHRQDEAGGS